MTLTEYQNGVMFAEIEATPEAAASIADWIESDPEFLRFGIGIDSDKKVKIVARAHAIISEEETHDATAIKSLPIQQSKGETVKNETKKSTDKGVKPVIKAKQVLKKVGRNGKKG